jgi:glutamate/tyrosine decarboxylase-like PLP-dependent enzyme
MSFPKQGMSKEEVARGLEAKREGDAEWQKGKTFSLVYNAGEDVMAVAKDAYLRFFSENALNPMAFPSLRRFERDVVKMVGGLFGGPDGFAGTLTSGGTESLLMAVKSAREHAKATRPGVTKPEMVVPITIHPAVEKAAHYFGVKAVHAPLRDDFRVDPKKAMELVTDQTILMMGSAPAYPHGVVDPIEELAGFAKERGLLFHVDACVGGMLLPWLERLGRKVPAWDFRVPGVTSISADLHKYGYTAKGASTVIYRSRELRRFQHFVYTDWPGGIYASPSVTGTRPGGPIAAAWAVLNYLGEDGYLRIARQTLDATNQLIEGISAIPGLRVMGRPDATIFAFTSDEVDVFMLGEAMGARGWKVDRQQLPAALHLMVTPGHLAVAGQFLADLRECTEHLRTTKPVAEGSAAMYGMLATFPDRTALEPMILDFMDGFETME